MWSHRCTKKYKKGDQIPAQSLNENDSQLSSSRHRGLRCLQGNHNPSGQRARQNSVRARLILKSILDEAGPEKGWGGFESEEQAGMAQPNPFTPLTALGCIVDTGEASVQSRVGIMQCAGMIRPACIWSVPGRAIVITHLA